MTTVVLTTHPWPLYGVMGDHSWFVVQADDDEEARHIAGEVHGCDYSGALVFVLDPAVTIRTLGGRAPRRFYDFMVGRAQHIIAAGQEADARRAAPRAARARYC